MSIPFIEFSVPMLKQGGAWVKKLEAPAPGAVSSVTRNGITWNFTSPQQVAQFADGSYAVLDSGSVEISSVTPTPTGTKNGSYLNPVTGDQPYDIDAGSGYDGGLAAAFPLTMVATDALISSESRTSEPNFWSGDVASSRYTVNSAEVLTCVSSLPTADTFRYGYCDRTHAVTLKTTDIVPANIASASMSGITSPSHVGFGTLEYFERGLERPWLLHVFNFQGRNVHPLQNMFGYHREVGAFLSEACALACTDIAGKDTLVNSIIQLGIDMYTIGLDGDGDSSYWTTPILLAGHWLDNAAMRDCFLGATILSVPRDYPDFYFWADRTDTTVTDYPLEIPAGETYSGHTVFFKNNSAVNREYEHLRPDEWAAKNGSGVVWTDDNYRAGIDTFQHVGMILAESLSGLQVKHNHDATFEMMQRYMIDADVVAELALLVLHHPENTGSPHVPDTAYLLGDSCTNDGHGYQCIVPGTTGGSSPPTGTDYSQTDGTVTWTYCSSPSPAAKTSNSPFIDDLFPPNWSYT